MNDESQVSSVSCFDKMPSVPFKGPADSTATRGWLVRVTSPAGYGVAGTGLELSVTSSWM